MHVVADQNAGVDKQAMFRGALAQQGQIAATVVVIQKYGAAIHSALGDVQYIPGISKRDWRGMDAADSRSVPVSWRAAARNIGRTRRRRNA